MDVASSQIGRFARSSLLAPLCGMFEHETGSSSGTCALYCRRELVTKAAKPRASWMQHGAQVPYKALLRIKTGLSDGSTIGLLPVLYKIMLFMYKRHWWAPWKMLKLVPPTLHGPQRIKTLRLVPSGRQSDGMSIHLPYACLSCQHHLFWRRDCLFDK